MNKSNKTHAVIYARVSDTKQKTEGDGLNSQATRCREYAHRKGYDVVRVFEDDASGSLIDRPGMKAMLAYLRQHRRQPHVVIIDDISRLARGLETHLQLRAAITDAGGRLESPSIEFGNDSDSLLVEHLLASVSQHQRQKNGEQVKNRMRARVQNGYWVFRAPVGYAYKRVPGHNMLLMRHEPLASIVQEALDGYASGRFQTQAEVGHFLESHPTYPRGRDGTVHSQRITDLLTSPVYAGCVFAPEWGVTLRKGHHAGLISMTTHQKIQARLKEDAKAPARKDMSLDFPLRGAVVCGHCSGALTACWSKGRSGHHAYYFCHRKGCESYGKSIRRAVIEGEFEALLRTLQPTENLFQVAYRMFEDLWNHRLAASATRVQSLKAERDKIAPQVEQLIDRIASTDIASVVTAYEGRIRKLEERRLMLDEQIASDGRPARSFDSALRTALEFLGSPWKLWVSGRFEDKRAVLKLAFADRLAYVRNEGFRTANLALPFKALAAFSNGKNEVVV